MAHACMRDKLTCDSRPISYHCAAAEEPLRRQPRIRFASNMSAADNEYLGHPLQTLHMEQAGSAVPFKRSTTPPPREI
jgi:hypothetical protein